MEFLRHPVLAWNFWIALIWSFLQVSWWYFFTSLKYVYNSLYLLPASFGCLLRAAERQPATLRLVKQSKSSKMINSKDKVDFLVQVTFFCNLEPFLFCVRGDMRARPRYADADSANLRAISADRKQKSFEMVKKIHMQNFSLLT